DRTDADAENEGKDLAPLTYDPDSEDKDVIAGGDVPRRRPGHEEGSATPGTDKDLLPLPNADDENGPDSAAHTKAPRKAGHDCVEGLHQHFVRGLAMLEHAAQFQESQGLLDDLAQWQPITEALVASMLARGKGYDEHFGEAKAAVPGEETGVG